MPATEYVLWGFHPVTTGGIPIKLISGNLRFINARARERKAEGWTVATTLEGLRLQAEQS